MKKAIKSLAVAAIAATVATVSASAATVKIIPSKSYARIGSKIQIKSEVSIEAGDDESLKEVKWASSDENVLTVDENGAAKGVSVGKAVVTATLPDGTQAKKTIKVKRKLAMKPKSVTLKVGKKKGLDLVDFDDSQATWKSSNKKVATVNGEGTVVAIKPGVATITAKAEGKTLKCKVTVKAAKLKMSAKSVDTYIGNKTYLSVSGASGKITWKSSNKKVARVDSDGKVTAFSTGKTTIAAKDANGAKATCKITVKGKRSELTLKAEGGDSAWLKKAQNAVNYIKMDRATYDRVLKYLEVVEQVKHVTKSRKSNMDVFSDVPTFTVGPTIYADDLYFASCIVHDAYHSKMYHDAEAAGRDGKSEYEGKAAEIKCCEIQRDFLYKVANATNDASVSSSARNYAAGLQEIISNPDSNEYWVSWESNPY